MGLYKDKIQHSNVFILTSMQKRYLSRRLPLRPFMIASMEPHWILFIDIFKNKDIHDIIIIIYIQIYKVTVDHFSFSTSRAHINTDLTLWRNNVALDNSTYNTI